MVGTRRHNSNNSNRHKVSKTPVIVKWRDITSWNGWNEETVDENLDEPTTFYTVGFIVRRTRDKLSLSDTYPEVGTLTVFPMGCVETIEKLDGKTISTSNPSTRK